ncbi:MAG TPA: oxalate/formate MFS antiporter [Gemmatimonadales bacterium]|jgi:OFA family oxalate/formate antiporter-like MFS transporter|nr:oxalate/formate MFS antiporter [Gemmatimonadales bacterium]
MNNTRTEVSTRTPGLVRWWQLLLGIICMSMIANLQYGWTLFVNPIQDKHHWGLAAIQVAFTVFVLVETWLVPLEGYLVDRFGPRLVGVTAGILVAAAWVINSVASTLPVLYLGAVIGGIGAGGVYGATIGNALKWFPDRRGLAAGLTAMGFGAGSALTVFPIAHLIKAQGYEAAFLKFGLAQGAVVFLLGWFLKAPDASFVAPVAATRALRIPAREHTPLEMLRTPAFWLLYVMFVLMAAGGLIATAQLTPIAKDFGIADTPVSLFGLTLLALPFALSLNRVLNGVSRPFFGWVSDHWGRENTMFVAFALEGVSILLLSRFGADPLAFVLLTALVFFAYGEIYSLFPATCGDAYGRKFASANAGLLYTAKGTASLLVPVSSLIAASLGGWRAVFVTAASMNLIAAALALLVLKPLCTRLGDA